MAGPSVLQDLSIPMDLVPVGVAALWWRAVDPPPKEPDVHPTRSIPSAIAISALIAAGLATAVAAPVAAAERTATLLSLIHI